MTVRVRAALAVVRHVAERPDPTEPLAVGTIAGQLALSLSSASRICSELEDEGMLERNGGYGSYSLGRSAIRLSGISAAPFARMLHFVMTLTAQQTGETVCLAARSGSALRIVDSVTSTWTLHAPARVGELVEDERSAIVVAARQFAGDASGAATPDASCVESTIGRSVEIATPVRDPSGECVAVLAVRLPLNRLSQNGARARRALLAARRRLESMITAELTAPLGPRPESRSSPTDDAGSVSAVCAALRILLHLASGPDSPPGIARATGLRVDRVLRLIDSCAKAGLVEQAAGRTLYRLGWSVQGWHRAASRPVLVTGGRPLVAEAAKRSQTCAFITVLAGMRSLTLVEQREMAGDGLEMISWLGRAHPIVGSDGGPTLLMDLEPDQLRQLFPARYTAQELSRFVQRVRAVTAEGVLSMQAFDGAGLISISAPVRDSSGAVAAAVCLVGTTDYMRANRHDFERETRELANRVSALLR